MYKQLISILFISLITLTNVAQAAQPKLPFPQNHPLGVQPDHVSKNSMNNSVKNFYNHWKSEYLRQAQTGGYYVHGADTDGEGKGTSESHGYGMIITVLMAGYDSNAQNTYNGLYEFFDDHRSSINNELMGWFIDDIESGSNTYSSATDGDLDIAYSLILAHRQWGSSGDINYLRKARTMLYYGIKAGDYNDDSKRLMRGDWDEDELTTRSSDWMPGHLSTFYKYTWDREWLKANKEIYNMLEEINVWSVNKMTGLMPDFVHQNPARPNKNDSTGESNTEHYYYNAARTPMRIAMGYLHYGNGKAKRASNSVASWARNQIIDGNSYDFNQYHSGYTVKGEPLPGSNYPSTAFISPILVAASVNPVNQQFINDGWDFIKSREESYFEDSINLLSMLILTGNWWNP